MWLWPNILFGKGIICTWSLIVLICHEVMIDTNWQWARFVNCPVNFSFVFYWSYNHLCISSQSHLLIHSVLIPRTEQEEGRKQPKQRSLLPTAVPWWICCTWFAIQTIQRHCQWWALKVAVYHYANIEGCPVVPQPVPRESKYFEYIYKIYAASACLLITHLCRRVYV